MKRRLSETEMKPELESDLQQTVATLVAQQVDSVLLTPVGGSAARFGRVAFGDQEQQSVNAFLHQKLGKDSLARRPGPGGRKLTYIESCKAIELANRAFGFNGWSCHIVECKEEYKEKKGDRWSIAYSSLVRIELKDGTSHEDVGFGTSDGQRDLGAALEQAKKASISDARKRALRLFGEYLGNSCYDREHIKDVNSNKPMAPLVAAPNGVLPGQQAQQAQTSEKRQPGLQNGQQNQTPQQNQAQQRPQQSIQQQQVQHPPRQQMPAPQAVQQQVQQQRQTVQQQQQRPQMPQQSMQKQQHQHQPQQQWKPPQVLRNPPTTNGPSSAQHQQERSHSAVSAASSRTATLQTAAGNSVCVSTAQIANSSSPFRPQPQRWVSSNAPPPPRMMASNYPPTIMKSEHPTAVHVQPNAQFNVEDLSLSQFDYDPNTENSNPAKKMRS